MVGAKVVSLLKESDARREASGVTSFSGKERKEATLILIDRDLDIVAPLRHGDNILDQIFETFPRESITSKGIYLLSMQNGFEHLTSSNGI